MPKSKSPQQENMLQSIFSARLRAEMERSGVNQQRLAEAVGCTQSDISRYKTGRIPGGDKLVALAKALGCQAEDLLSESPNPRAREASITPDMKPAIRLLRAEAKKLRDIADHLDAQADTMER